MDFATIVLSLKITFYLLGALSILLVIIAIKPIMKRIKNMIMGARGYGVIKHLSPTGNWIDSYVKFQARMEEGEQNFLLPKGFRGTIDEGIATLHYPTDDCNPIDFYAQGYEVELNARGDVLRDERGVPIIVKRPVISPEEQKVIVDEAKMIATEQALMSSNNDAAQIKLLLLAALALLVVVGYLSFQDYSMLTSMQQAAR